MERVRTAQISCIIQIGACKTGLKPNEKKLVCRDTDYIIEASQLRKVKEGHIALVEFISLENNIIQKADNVLIDKEIYFEKINFIFLGAGKLFGGFMSG